MPFYLIYRFVGKSTNAGEPLIVLGASSFAAREAAFLIADSRLSPPSIASFNIPLKLPCRAPFDFRQNKSYRNPAFFRRPTPRGLRGE